MDSVTEKLKECDLDQRDLGNVYFLQQYHSCFLHLPKDVNNHIISYVIGENFNAGVLESVVVESYLSKIHDVYWKRIYNFLVCKYDPVLYLDREVDCRDITYVNESLSVNLSKIDWVRTVKMLVLTHLVAVVPTVDAVRALPYNNYQPFFVNAYIDPNSWMPTVYVALGVFVLTLLMAHVINGFITFVYKRVMEKLFICILDILFWIFMLPIRLLRFIFYYLKTKYELLFLTTSIKEPLRNAEGCLPASVVQKVETGEGMIYFVRAGGNLYRCTEDYGAQLEMAQPGSVISRSKKRPVGAIVCVIDGESYVVGGFFRIENILVTAHHVAAQIVANQGEYRYVGFNHKDDRSILDLSKSKPIIEDEFFLENNLITTTVPDLFAIRKDPSFWSILNITAASFAASHYNQVVTTSGVRDGVLVGATGKTAYNEDAWLLNHSASTIGGFSGFPVFCGNRVVGMHVSGAPHANQLLRIEVILELMPKKETNQHIFGKIVYGSRRKGKLTKRLILFDRYAERDDQGYVYFPLEDVSTNIPYDTALDYTDDIPVSDPVSYYGLQRHNVQKESAPIHSFSQKADQSLTIQDYSMEYVPPVPGPPEWLKEKDRKKKKSKKKPVKESSAVDYVKVGTMEQCMVPRLPIVNTESTTYLQGVKEKLEVLGYEDKAYEWPSIGKTNEEVSLLKHLSLFARRVRETSPDKLKPDHRVVPILVKTLESLKYEVDPEYKSRETFKNIIMSSQIKDNKSPGIPYCTQGMANNAAVIDNLGVDGLADTVLSTWDDPLLLRVFCKGEPHKLKKIIAEMIRIIAGFPLPKTIKHTSIFNRFSESVIKFWLDSPVKYCYSPLVPRNNHHLKDVFRKSEKIWMSDKTNWDFNMFKKYYHYFAEVVCALAVRPSCMTMEDFEEYKNEVRKAVNEVSDATYVCSSGNMYKSIVEGIMKSGWFCTINANSISQLAVHIEVLLQLGLSSEAILDRLEKEPIVVGGDDVLQQKVSGFTKEQYEEASKVIGVTMEITEVDFQGCEFFSHKLYAVERSVKAIPTRFTKHIETLKRTAKDEVGSALVSLMQEWIWDDDKFEFFHDMFMALRQSSDNPDGKYPLKNIPIKDNLRNYLDGLEGGWLVENELKQLHRTILERREASIQC